MARLTRRSSSLRARLLVRLAHPGRAARVVAFLGACLAAPALPAGAQAPKPMIVESPTLQHLKGLTVPEFEAEMQLFVQAVGGSCGTCHARGNFASDDNPTKLVARRMIAMTQAINAQNFPDYKPAEGQSRLGKVTCYTCHQGNAVPKGSIEPR